MQVKFVFGKETKGAIQFKEVPEGEFGVERVGSLYVKKHALPELGGDAIAKGLVVTIEVAP